MCTEGAAQEEHDACRELLGYCPYCEEAQPYPKVNSVMGRLQLPEQIDKLAFDTLVINGQ